MNNKGLTEKEREILYLFLTNGNYRVNQGKVYLAYPAKIESDLKGKVTRVWAGKICKDFEKRGILGYKMIRPRRQKNKTEHYFLKKDLKATLEIARICLISSNKLDAWIFLNQMQDSINISLVKEVMFQKKVEMRRIIDLIDWKEKEARCLLEIRNEKEKENIRSLNELNKEKDKQEYTPVSYEEYVDRIADKKRKKTGLWMPYTITMHLPVLPNNMKKVEKKKILKKLNVEEFKSNLLHSNYSGIEHHYRHWEREKLLIPILALIQISSSALTEFLFGSWKPFEHEYCLTFTSGGTEMVDHLLFRLMFKAIGEIAVTRNVPEGSIVEDAWVRGGHQGGDKEEALLCLQLKNRRKVYYDGGFDTTHLYYGDGEFIYEAESNPENCWMKSWIVSKEMHN